jgi:hypothetical protein
VNRVDVRLAARPLALADLAAFNPSVPATGQMELDAQARGEGDLITAHLAASLDRGRLTLDGGTRLREGKPTSYRVHGEVSRSIRRGSITRRRPATSTPDSTRTCRAPFRAPTAACDWTSGARGSAACTCGSSGLARCCRRGQRISRSSARSIPGVCNATGRARPFDSLPTYRFSGTAVGMPGTGAVARALAGADGDPSLAVAFRLAGSGTSPDSGRANGRVDLAAVRDTGARRALGHATLRLAEGRLDVRPEILAGGGAITAVGRVTWATPWPISSATAASTG